MDTAKTLYESLEAGSESTASNGISTDNPDGCSSVTSHSVTDVAITSNEATSVFEADKANELTHDTESVVTYLVDEVSRVIGGNVSLDYRSHDRMIEDDGNSDSSSESSDGSESDDWLESLLHQQPRGVTTNEMADDDDEYDRCVKKTNSSKDARESTRVRGEVFPEELPPLEDLKITIDEKVELVPFGEVTGIVDTLVVIKSFPNLPALDEETVLFTEDRTFLGTIFEIFGPVADPSYAVRFNTSNDIKMKGIEIGTKVRCALKEDGYTKFIFLTQLKQVRGSDASWEGNLEPPDEHRDYSDDEAERQAKKVRRKKLHPDVGDKRGSRGSRKSEESGISQKAERYSQEHRQTSFRGTGGMGDNLRLQQPITHGPNRDFVNPFNQQQRNNFSRGNFSSTNNNYMISSSAATPLPPASCPPVQSFSNNSLQTQSRAFIPRYPLFGTFESSNISRPGFTPPSNSPFLPHPHDIGLWNRPFPGPRTPPRSHWNPSFPPSRAGFVPQINNQSAHNVAHQIRNFPLSVTNQIRNNLHTAHSSGVVNPNYTYSNDVSGFCTQNSQPTFQNISNHSEVSKNLSSPVFSSPLGNGQPTWTGPFIRPGQSTPPSLGGFNAPIFGQRPRVEFR